MRGSPRPTLPRGVLIWLLGLMFGVVAGAVSIYLIAGAPAVRPSLDASADAR